MLTPSYTLRTIVTMETSGVYCSADLTILIQKHTLQPASHYMCVIQHLKDVAVQGWAINGLNSSSSSYT